MINYIILFAKFGSRSAISVAKNCTAKNLRKFGNLPSNINGRTVAFVGTRQCRFFARSHNVSQKYPADRAVACACWEIG
jgi:hypothetical protein